MFEGLSFNELKDLVANKRSMSFEQFFGEMELSDDEIQKRIKLAEKLEDGFLFVLALLFTMQQNNAVDWEQARVEYESRYLSALSGYVASTPYIQQYVRGMSYDIIDSTKRNQDKYYYYSPDRGKFMAECEANTARSYQCNEEALRQGKTMKRWITMEDNKVRQTHRKVDRTSKSIEEPFVVGNSLLQFPRDFSLGAEEKEICGCRCSIQYY